MSNGDITCSQHRDWVPLTSDHWVALLCCTEKGQGLLFCVLQLVRGGDISPTHTAVLLTSMGGQFSYAYNFRTSSPTLSPTRMALMPFVFTQNYNKSHCLLSLLDLLVLKRELFNSVPLWDSHSNTKSEQKQKQMNKCWVTILNIVILVLIT